MAKNNTEKRINILTKSECDDFYSLPKFDLLQRQKNFTLSEEEIEVLNNLALFKSKIFFILQLGYLREKPLIHQIIFYERKEDINFILKTYFHGHKFPRGSISKRSQSNIVNKALNFIHVSRTDKSFHQKLDIYLKDIATICVESRYLFDECLNFYELHKKVLDSYRTYQDKISLILNGERKRLESIINTQLSPTTKSFFQQLLVVENALSDLTKLRKNPKTFKGIDVKRELESHQKLQPIYSEIKAIVEILNISAINLSYYSSLINYYSVTKLRRFSESLAFLYLTCFTYFRYQQINDNLITIFSYKVRKHKDSSILYGQKKMLELSSNLWDEMKRTLPFLSIFIDEDIKNTQPIGELRESLFNKLSKEDLTAIYHKIETTDADKKEYGWQYFDKHQRLISTQIRPIFLAIDLEMCDLDSIFYNQITVTKQELSTLKMIKTIDKRIFTHDAKKYLIKDEEVNTRRFEYFLYNRVNQGIIKGDIYITESEKYRQLEDHLIEKNLWKKERQIFIEKTSLPKLTQSVESLLDSHENQLEQRIKMVCQNITSGDNRFVVLTDRKEQLKWSIAVQKDEQSINNPFFSYLPKANIADLMAYVDQTCNFLSAFKHIKTSQPITEAAAKDDLIACVIADGTNYGLEHMSNISDRSFVKLRQTEISYLQMENIQKSNDILTNEIAKLPIFKYYTIENDRLYASIDGQKFETRISTFKSRYSSKYFKEKGVSALTLSCNHVALKTKVIGANEYEGHFAFDLLYNNTSDIEPEVLSTDTHGTNQVNFAILDLFGYKFAPRYARLKKVFGELFDVVKNNDKDPFIHLKRPINRKLIIEEWDEIQRIICSLSRKTITQATLIQKLSTFSSTNRTLAALREYDQLIKVNYILHYIDDHSLRKYIQKTLSRGEAYHQLRRKISSVNGDKFRGGNDLQVEIWNECARLIANSIIFFNASILSSLLIKFDHNEKMKDIIIRLSPVAWKNINLNGIYAFGAYETITMELLLANISEENTEFISFEEDEVA